MAMLMFHSVLLANVWLNDCAYYVHSYAHHKHKRGKDLIVLNI